MSKRRVKKENRAYGKVEHDRLCQRSKPWEKRAADSSVQPHCLGETWLHCENPRLALSRLQCEVGSRAINLAPR